MSYQPFLSFPRRAASGVVDIIYQTQTSVNPAGTSHTFTSQSIGTAAASRQVVVGVWGIRVGGYTVSSVSVAGISATQIVTASPTGVRRVDIWTAAVPTGTSADIIVTTSATNNAVGIAVWSMTGASTTANATATDTDGSSPQTGSVNVPANGAAVGMILINASASTTWSGITEDADATGTLADSNSMSVASLEFSSAQTPLSISATPSGSASLSTAAFASWGPA